ncbi:MAG: hypothetical protein RQ751_10835 [Longimicrobiales bacterium]|nr:hypothetical protein [Longimicrobiales bacterium]
MSRSWREPVDRRREWTAAPPRWAAPAVLAALALLCLTPPAAVAQSRMEQAFLHAAAAHFGVAEGEVLMLARGAVSVGEIPVVLHLAQRAGVSAEAILALRRAGRSWSDLIRQYRMHAGQLHVPLEPVPAAGPLAPAYAAYASRPRDAWAVIVLPDEALVALVNLRFLMDYLDQTPDRVALALTETGDAVAAYGRLLGRNRP